MTAAVKAAWEKFLAEKLNPSDAADIAAAKGIAKTHAVKVEHSCFQERRTRQIFIAGIDAGMLIERERMKAATKLPAGFFEARK